MEENKVEQSNHHLSTQRTGEEFWEDLMKKPYNENKAGQSYVTETFKRRLLDKKDSEKNRKNRRKCRNNYFKMLNQIF